MSQISNSKRITHSQRIEREGLDNVSFTINRSATVNEALDEVTERSVDNVELRVESVPFPFVLKFENGQVKSFIEMAQEVLDKIEEVEA